jgi:hypothetical protein
MSKPYPSAEREQEDKASAALGALRFRRFDSRRVKWYIGREDDEII